MHISGVQVTFKALPVGTKLYGAKANKEKPIKSSCLFTGPITINTNHHIGESAAGKLESGAEGKILIC